MSRKTHPSTLSGPAGVEPFAEDRLPQWVRDRLDAARADAVDTGLLLVAWDMNHDKSPLQMHLSFSEGRTCHAIHRTGRHSPRMHRDPPFEDFATDPEVQWHDSWFITRAQRLCEMVNVVAQLACVYQMIDAEARPGAWAEAVAVLADQSPFRDRELERFIAETRLDTSVASNIQIEQWAPVPHCLAGLETPLANHRKFNVAASVLTLRALADPTEHQRLQLRKWLALLESHRLSGCHDQQFETWARSIPGSPRLIAHQGCGDLSLNLWHVAFIAEGPTAPQPYTVVLPDEEVEHNAYPCLVRWKPGMHPYGGRNLEFTELRFRRTETGGHAARLVQFRDRAGRWIDVGDRIVFAVSGKRIVWESRAVPLLDTIHTYADLRHVFELPNLNPTSALTLPGVTDKSFRHRPRPVFCRLQWDDVWLAEAALMANPQYRRSALSEPVLLTPDDLGTIPEHIIAALESHTGSRQPYRRVTRQPNEPGQYRIIEHQAQPSFDIFFRRNTYPYSILGIHEDGRLISCVWQGPYCDQRHGFTIEEIARLLQELGVESALLFEEGSDPYLRLCEAPDLSIPARRHKRPAVFLMTSAAD